MSRDAAASVSIVIPTRNRRDSLARCLAAVAALEYAGPLETVVVDDAGAGRIEPALEPTAAKLGHKLIRAGGDGPATARNLGAAAGEGKLIAFLDDDCAPRPDWLALLVARVGTATRLAAGGRTVNALPGNSFSVASQMIDDAVHRCLAQGETEPATFLSSSNVIFPAEALAGIGGFDETFPVPGGEDRDLCMRWVESGGELVLEQQAVVDHAHELTLRSFLRQHHSYGRGAWTARRAKSRRSGEKLDRTTADQSGIVSAALRSARSDGIRQIALISAWRAATWSGVGREALADLLGRR